ncbi:response regulator [Algibacter sp. R77976]|uniref:response regulator n=1 Tax=Algibacter sp. R77976 TaxID=3093873 RepID=UPI0037C8021C
MSSDLFNKSKTFFENEKYDSAYVSSKKSFQLLKNLKNDSLTIASALLAAQSKDFLKKLDSTDYIGYSEQLALKNKDWKSLIEIYFTRGNIFFNQSEEAMALPFFLKVDSIAKINSYDNFTTIQSLNKRAEISKLSFTYDSTNLAYDIALQALKRAKKINSQDAINYTHAHLADLAQMRNEYTEAMTYTNLALDYYLKKDKQKYVSRMYLIKSAIYLELDSIDKADETRYKAIQYLSDKNNDYAMAKAKYYYGHFLRYDKYDYKKASTYLEESRILLEKSNQVDNEVYHRCLRDLAICYDNLGNHEKSKNYYKQAYNLKIELNKKANRNTSRRLETKYQTEKKEQEIALLKSEKALNEQKQKSQRNLLVGGLSLTTIAGLFLFVLYRNRQKTNIKLKELDSAKSNFFANISHEFRTPLTLITNPIDEAIDDESLSDKKREQFVMAKRNSDRLLGLVNQLLDLSKIDAGQLKLHIQKGNIQNLISGLAESFIYSAKQNNIDYQLQIEKSNNDTWFDKDALEKITINLLSNAIKYTPNNGTVICNAFIENNIWQFSVKNIGIGLTKEQQDTIFTRFYQTDERNQGTGIGLALVKELVELHKGTIKVESKPNTWINFLVKLPVDKNSFKNEVFVESSGINIDYEPTKLETVNVIDDVFEENDKPILLIVEDNVDVRVLLKQTFQDFYNIITAENGQIGIDLAIKHVPDIIISDIMMPVKDGVELTKTLKNNELTSHIPVVLLTAKAGDKNELEGLEIGADDYITKPFNSKLLKTKVSNLIDIRRKLQSRYSQEIILTPKDIAVTNLDEQFLTKVQEVLEANLVESSFNIENFSKAVGMSRMQLHRKIKALTGLSASEFVRSQRLKLAAELLKTSDINISQVGYSVGFNDHSYFTKCFKEAYNCTPTEFSKKHESK